MILNNSVTWWGKKINKTAYGILLAETAINMFVTSVYRKVFINHFFEKMFYKQASLSSMKNPGVVLIPLIFLLSGCLAAPVKPSSARMDQIHTVLVVPVESPPLEVIPDLIEARFPVYRQYQYQELPYYAFLDKKIYKSPGGVLIAGLVSEDDSVPVADLRQSSASTENIASLEPLASLQDNWTPTFSLAQEAASQFKSSNVKTILSKDYYRLPIASGDRNANLGNWRDAIRQWYSQDSSAINYRQTGLENIDAVLEVGIESYRIFDVQTSLQVLVKLIDPLTRQVIARTHAKTISVEDSPQTLLSHEAENLKQLVARMGMQLLAQNFANIGLPLKVSDLRTQPVQASADKLIP
jgi:hypothetical protein